MNNAAPIHFPQTENAFAPFRPFEKEEISRPDFSLDWFPDCAVKEFTVALNNWISAKPDLAAIIAMGYVAAMAQGRTKITAQAGMFYDLNLYLVVSMKVAQRKSTAYIKFRNMVTDFENELNRQIMIESATFRAMLDIIAENEESVFITSGDGGIVKMLCSIPDEKLDLFLKAYSGEPYRYNTSTSGSVNLAHPLASLLLLAQEEPVRRMIRTRTLIERGLLSRCLIAYPNPVDAFPYEGQTVDELIMEAAKESLHSILCDDVQGDGVITLSSSARELHRDYYYQIEGRSEELTVLGDWKKRIMENMTRITGVLHVMENGTAAPVIPVPRSTVERSICIMNYYIAHGLFAAGRDGNDQTHDAAYLLNRIMEISDDRGIVKKRDLKQKCRSYFGKDGRGENSLKMLQDRGYIRTNVRISEGGGRPSIELELNPEFLSTI